MAGRRDGVVSAEQCAGPPPPPQPDPALSSASATALPSPGRHNVGLIPLAAGRPRHGMCCGAAEPCGSLSAVTGLGRGRLGRPVQRRSSLHRCYLWRLRRASCPPLPAGVGADAIWRRRRRRRPPLSEGAGCTALERRRPCATGASPSRSAPRRPGLRNGPDCSCSGNVAWLVPRPSNDCG